MEFSFEVHRFKTICIKKKENNFRNLTVDDLCFHRPRRKRPLHKEGTIYKTFVTNPQDTIESLQTFVCGKGSIKASFDSMT